MGAPLLAPGMSPLSHTADFFPCFHQMDPGEPATLPRWYVVPNGPGDDLWPHSLSPWQLENCAGIRPAQGSAWPRRLEADSHQTGLASLLLFALTARAAVLGQQKGS